MQHDPFLEMDPHSYGLAEAHADDVALLNTLLGDTLAEQGIAKLRDLASGLLDASTLPDDPTATERLLRAFTVFFQLLNTSEQVQIVRANRARKALGGEATSLETVRGAVRRLRRSGLSALHMQALLADLDICPVLTAHPTEARRRSVLDKLHDVARMLAARSRSGSEPDPDAPLNPRGADEADLRRVLTALWQTDEVRSTALTVDDEVRNVLYFFEHTILRVVPWLHEEMREALAAEWPGVDFEMPAFLRYRSWVGGDRDGNPNVTPDVTWRAVLAHRGTMLRHCVERVEALRREITMSQDVAPVSAELIESLAADRQAMSDHHVPAAAALEPYGAKLTHILIRLAAAQEHVQALLASAPHSADWPAPGLAYVHGADLERDLQLIARSLADSGGERLVTSGPLAELLTQVRTFGLHLAALDIRQHSDEHEWAVGALLSAAGELPPGRRYDELAEADKIRLLTREICSPRPLVPADWAGDARAQMVIDTFRAIRAVHRCVSTRAVTHYVVSMTHALSDVLEALLLAREAGLVRWETTEGGERRLQSDIDIVPLVETIDDLREADTLLAALFANRAYRAQLDARGRAQEVMLGYSDSSKDGGYLAANWSLHDTQARIATVCRRRRVKLLVFHGRGGTVGRGGGRASRAIASQPPGAFEGGIRFTEQGEIIAFRYGLPAIAHRHLEQIVSAALLTAARPRRQTEDQAWSRVMTELASGSRAAYRALVHDDPEFWGFYTQATPIAHISKLPIASRPAYRPDRKAVGLDDLRAIPWVFAWVQSRYVLPGWYGVGSALSAYAARGPREAAELRSMYEQWPFFRMVLDNAQLELVRAHMPTASLYAARVRPAELGAKFHARIQQEYDLTCAVVLAVTGQATLLEREQVVRRTVELRNPLVLPLSRMQVALMDHWDRSGAEGAGSTDPWHAALLLSIAGIAAAMHSTG